MSDLSLFYCDTATFGEAAPNIQQVCVNGVLPGWWSAEASASVPLDGWCLCRGRVALGPRTPVARSHPSLRRYKWQYTQRCTRAVTVLGFVSNTGLAKFGY